MSLFKLLKYKLKIFARNFTRGAKRTKRLRMVVVAVMAAAFVGFAVGAYGIFKTIALFGPDSLTLAGLVVLVTFHAILILAFLVDMAATISFFFLSSDLSLLMVSPLPTLRVFASKYLEAMGSGSLITSLIAFPVLFGFGLAFDAPWGFYLASVGVFAVFLSIPVSVGTLASMLISRYIAPSRVREVLGVAGTVVGVGIWFLIQLLKPALQDGARAGDMVANLRAAASYGDNLVMNLLPSSAAARGLVSIASGDAPAGIGPLLSLAVMAGGLLIASILLARRMYLAGWVRVAPMAGEPRKGLGRLPLRRIFRWLPPFEKSIVTTNGFLFLRDPQHLMPVATVTIMMAAFPLLVGLYRSAAELSPVRLLQSFAAMSFIGSLNLAVNATGIDGRNFWLTLASPHTALRKLFSKLLISVVFFVPLVAVATLGLRLAGLMTWIIAAKAVWFAVCMTFAGAALGVFLALVYVDWEWEVPRRMLKVSGRLLMVAVMGGFFGVIAILMGPDPARADGGLLDRAPWTLLLLGGAGVAIATYVLLRISASRLERMEWTL